MTIRIQHLTIDHDECAWLFTDKGEDVTLDETRVLDFLSIVRHIMRERGDCNIVPVVKGVMAHETNRYGHNVQIEVQYHTRGHRAIYGAHVGERVTRVQCYMD